MKHAWAAIGLAALGLAVVAAPATSAGARCPAYLLKSSIGELCWDGAWRPYERNDWRDQKYYNDKYRPGSPDRNKPKWRFKSGQGGNMKNR